MVKQKAVRFLAAAVLGVIAAVVPRPAAAVMVDTSYGIPREAGWGGSSTLGGAMDPGMGAAHFNVRFGSILSDAHRIPVEAGFTWVAQDNAFGEFGTGTLSSYDWFLSGDSTSGYWLIGPDRRWYNFHHSLGSNHWSDTTDPGAAGANLFANLTNRDPLTWKDGTTWYFDSAGTGGLVGITDPHGRSIIADILRNSYTGQPLTIYLDAQPGYSSRMITYKWGYQGSTLLVISVAIRYNYSTTPDANPSPVDKVWNFTYASLPGTNYEVSTITDPLGHVTNLNWTTYTRNGGGAVTLPLLTSVVTPLGNTAYSNQYDSYGRLIKQTCADNGYTSISYSAALGTSGTTTVTDPLGRVTTYNYTWPQVNGVGYHVDSATDPLGRTTSWAQYSTNKFEHQITDYRGRVVISRNYDRRDSRYSGRAVSPCPSGT